MPTSKINNKLILIAHNLGEELIKKNLKVYEVHFILKRIRKYIESYPLVHLDNTSEESK